ncbi:MAG: hypothetical protein WCV86_02345 [Patescibacteria group bacterium]|jgi:hypothetical protein
MNMQYLKKDLILVSILSFFIVGAYVLLYFLEQNSGFLTDVAAKLSI